MNHGLYFRNNPVEIRVSIPCLGYVCITLVSCDNFETTYLELNVRDDLSHALDVVKELLEFYES